MSRFVAIFLGVVLFVAALAFWEPLLGFFENIFNRPYQSLTDDQLRNEIALAENVVTILAQQSMDLARRPAGLGNTLATRESWAEVNKNSARLRQLRAELAFRVERVRYVLIGAFAVAFLAFFLFFRDTYRSSIRGTHDREKAGAKVAGEVRDFLRKKKARGYSPPALKPSGVNEREEIKK